MLKIAVSARALFNMDDGHVIFESQGQEAFDAYMRETEDKPLRPGPAFNLVRKLLKFNSEGQKDHVEIVLVSRNSPDSSGRVSKSIAHYGLNIERAAFMQGLSRYKMLQAMGIRLFLSRHPQEVREALDRGLAAATLLPYAQDHDGEDVVKIGFDGDAVLFSDEAERVNHHSGLDAFIKSELANAQIPLGDGPFRPLLEDLMELKKVAGDRLQIALITARGLMSQGRVLTTLRSWNLKVDIAAFCDGARKGPILSAMDVDFFFDDGVRNTESATEHSIPCGHVPSGISNASHH